MTAGATFQGTRVADYDEYFHVGAGAYWKLNVEDEPQPLWMNTPPCGHPGRLATQLRDGQRHQVTEHEDGTITVSPSIWCQAAGPKSDQACWHGYLKRGVWREI